MRCAAATAKSLMTYATHDAVCQGQRRRVDDVTSGCLPAQCSRKGETRETAWPISGWWLCMCIVFSCHGEVVWTADKHKNSPARGRHFLRMTSVLAHHATFTLSMSGQLTCRVHKVSENRLNEHRKPSVCVRFDTTEATMRSCDEDFASMLPGMGPRLQMQVCLCPQLRANPSVCAPHHNIQISRPKQSTTLLGEAKNVVSTQRSGSTVCAQV